MCLFFINDNVDIAIRCHAEGIHVGQEDMAAAQVRQRVGDEMMIGVSVHSVEEALEAVRHGADCLGVGAAFSTHTKADVDVLPEGMMKAICDAVDIPVVAIGGIHKENLLRLRGTGVNGVAPCQCDLRRGGHRGRVQGAEGTGGAAVRRLALSVIAGAMPAPPKGGANCAQRKGCAKTYFRYVQRAKRCSR